MAPRSLFDERIANTKAGKSSKVTVNRPQLTDSVLHNKCGDMGIMRQVSLGLPLAYNPAKMGSVCKSLSQKDEGW
jgi:hypothetical protein